MWRHVTRRHASCEWVMLHHTREYVMPHLWMRHVTHMSELRSWMRHHDERFLRGFKFVNDLWREKSFAQRKNVACVHNNCASFCGLGQLYFSERLLRLLKCTAFADNTISSSNDNLFLWGWINNIRQKIKMHNDKRLSVFRDMTPLQPEKE